MARVGLTFRRTPILGAGILAGLLFALFEMIAAALIQGPSFLFMPLRLIATILLGPAALEPTYSLIVAAVTGGLLVVVLSVCFAFVFAAIVHPAWTDSQLATAGMAFGLIIWVLNFYGIAPSAGWWWFAERTNPAVQFLAHVFFFGCPLGWLLARSRVAIAV